MSAAASLGNFGAPGGPLAIFFSLLIHSVSSTGQCTPRVMYEKASWAGPTTATARVTGSTWAAQSGSSDKTWSSQIIVLLVLRLSSLTLFQENGFWLQHLSHEERACAGQKRGVNLMGVLTTE